MELFRIILECLIIITLAWYVYRAFHGTRGGMALVGMCILLAGVIGLVFLFKLERIEQFLRVWYWLIIVALIAVFQPELRRLFVGVGESVFQRGKSNRSFVIEHIVQAIAQLQEKNSGALIAVERRPAHYAARESGVAIGGKVTEELLVTIFTDRTPLHDGGVIISEDKILVAGCIFPLTTRQDLDRNFGLRHRAALGFSNESDVVVVVLSEERGEISIAFKGELERGLTHDELRQRLTELLLPKKSKSLPANDETPEITT